MNQRMEALEAATAESQPGSLAAAERLRSRFSPEDAAWALTQVELRRSGQRKVAHASQMVFTRAGLEQATRASVAAWRARRFLAAGVRQVWDLGCGIGSDAMALVEAGLEVVAVDADPETVEVARHNLALVGGAEVRLARAEEVDVPTGAGVFLDPARRTARGRTWRVEDFTPPWSLVLDYLASPRFAAVKLGPGVPKEMLPREAEACWVSDRGDVVEASLWNRRTPGAAAVLLPGEATLSSAVAPSALPVGRVGRYLLEPDGAVIRAGLVAAAAPAGSAWLLDSHTAYLSSDEPLQTPFATTFEVLEDLDYDRRTLRAWIREHGIGTLEIKKRGLEVDPAQLRAQLKPKGPGSATLILARTPAGARALVARRVASSHLAQASVDPVPSSLGVVDL